MNFHCQCQLEVENLLVIDSDDSDLDGCLLQNYGSVAELLIAAGANTEIRDYDGTAELELTRSLVHRD